MEDLSNWNFESLMKGIEIEAQTWKATSYFQAGRINIVKIFIWPKTIYIFNNPYEITSDIFSHNSTSSVKFIRIHTCAQYACAHTHTCTHAHVHRHTLKLSRAKDQSKKNSTTWFLSFMVLIKKKMHFSGEPRSKSMH